MNPRRDPEVRRLLDELLAHVSEAQDGEGAGHTPDFLREILLTSLRFADGIASRAELKLIHGALRDLRRAFHAFAPYREVRKVAVFGSARTPRGHPDWQQAQRFAERMVEEGWMVITGAGDGIMAAAQGGAGRASSFGVNIRLPFEQDANPVIAGDPKLVNFRYFFTRKVAFVKEAHAMALFPGGFGTHDEGFETLTLIQTGRSEILPVIFVDAPGGTYWQDWRQYVESHLLARGLISPEDEALFRVTDDVETAVDELKCFYRNYHSSRFVGDLLVLRVRRAPDPRTLEALNDEFADAVSRGRIEVSGPLPEEAGEVDDYPRVTFRFDRRKAGRLRQLINRLNVLAPGPSSPRRASPHQVIELPAPELPEGLGNGESAEKR